MMQITIWGARGSHPTPLSPDAIRSKIATVVQRARPSDLESADTRERFLATLPDWLFGTTGGNTACVEVNLPKGQIILDAGTGIIPLAQQELRRRPRREEYHIFFTHFHYDHVQGFPFFVPAFIPTNHIHFYSPIESPVPILSRQMYSPYFPIQMEDKMSKNMHGHVLTGESLALFGSQIRWRELNHPGRAFAYRIDHGGRSFCYCTDVELIESDFHRSEENERFFENLDVLILDTQYTLDEAIEKYSWGHSSFSLGVDFAVTWKVKQLLLFHHEPQYNDRKLQHNLQSARWYADRIGGTNLQIELASEGATIELP